MKSVWTLFWGVGYAVSLAAAECVWQGASGASWGESSSWQNGAVPQEGDTVSIAGGDVKVTDGDAAVLAAIAGINLGADARLVFDNASDLNVNAYINGEGGVLKLGTGTVFYNAIRKDPLSLGEKEKCLDYNYSGRTIISNGMIRLPDFTGKGFSGTLSPNIGGYTIIAPGVLSLSGGDAGLSVVTHMKGTLFGDGTITNGYSSGGPWQLRLENKSGSEFAGKITGNIRFYSSGKTYFTGVENDFPNRDQDGNAFAVQSGGYYGLRKIGNKDEPSSMGYVPNLLYREGGGTYLYLGEGEETDKTLSMVGFNGDNFKWSTATIDAGAVGGLTFNGEWSESYTNCVTTVILKGSNTVPCVVNGAYKQSESKERSTYIRKEGTGTWTLRHHPERGNNGVIEVKEGTLQFDTIANKGEYCALGLSSDLRRPESGTNNRYYSATEVDYAFLLGSSDNRLAVFEYIGSTFCRSIDRPVALDGPATIGNGGTGIGFFALEGVSSVRPDEIALTLAADADKRTSYLACISNGAGVVSIVKTGAGTWGIYGTNTLTGSVRVEEGTLRLGKPEPRLYKYFRFTVKETQKDHVGSQDSNVQLHEFALYDKEGRRQNIGLELVAYDAVLGEGQMQYHKDAGRSWYTDRDADKLVDDRAVGNGWCITYGTAKISYPDSWYKLTMRLADDVPEIASYDFCSCQGWSNDKPYGRELYAYSIEASEDGTNWVMMADVEDVVPPQSGGCWYSDGTKFASGAVRTGFEFPKEEFAPCELAHVSNIVVAPGATLQGSETDVVTIPALGVDCAQGGGTVKNIDFAATGTLHLTNFTARESYALPMTFVDVSNLSNLRNWTLTINGEEANNKKISVQGNRVSIVSVGTVILLR